MQMEDSELTNEQIEKIFKQIGKNVKKYRNKKNISQLALSLQMGHKAVGTVSMAEICINNKHFNIKHLAQISKILNVKICNFFDGVDEIIEKEKK